MESKEEFFNDIIDEHDLFLRQYPEDVINSVKSYTKQAYKTVNEGLRRGRKLKIEDQKIVNDLDLLFENIPPITKTLTLYRGVKSFGNATKAGLEPAFVSASYEFKQAIHFTRGNCCIMVFTIPPGSKVLFVETVSNCPFEREVILDRNGTLHVSKYLNDSLKPYSNGAEIEQYKTINITYISNMSVSISNPTELSNVVKVAVDHLSYMERIVDNFEFDEWSMYDEEDLNLLKISIIDLFKRFSGSDEEPNESFVLKVIQKLKDKFEALEG